MRKSINEKPIRCQVLANGPLQIQIKGTKKGKKGYNRKKIKKDLDNDHN